MVNKNNNKKKVSKKFIVLRGILLILNIVILLYLYYLLTIVGATPPIIILILLFTFFLFTGPFLKGRKKTYYSTIFPKQDKTSDQDLKKRLLVRKRQSISNTPQKNIPDINLQHTYKKAPVKKCSNCGMILASFVKKCPVCGEIVKD